MKSDKSKTQARERRDNTLRESKETYRTLVESSAQGILIADRETKRQLYANPAICQMLGYTREELTKMTVMDIHPKDSLEDVMAGFSAVTTDLRGPRTLPCIRKNGKVIYADIAATRATIDGRDCNVGFFTDVTTRENAIRTLVESEEKFRSLAEYSPNMVFINQDGRIVYANRQCEETMGYKKEEFYAPGFNFISLIAPKDRELVMANFRRHMTSEDIPPYDYALITKDGRQLDVILSTKLIDYQGSKAIVGIMTDVTERKRTEETLKLQAELLDLELDSVYVLDFDGNFLYVNKAACSIHGYTPEELLGMKLGELDDPESEKLIAVRFKEIQEKGKAIFELNHRHKNGTLIPLEVHVSVVELRGKKVIMNVARDISERKKVQQQLLTQDRLASIGQLVSGVAHELNNPLTSVVGFSDLLLQRELPDDIKADLQIINDEAKRTSLIVRNLLTFARQQPGEKQAIDINQPITAVLQLRRHEQGINNIKVVEQFAPDLPQVIGNSSQLQQVFFNIVTNAEQAMLEAHNKGTLTITTKQIRNFARASFTDDGPGIAREHMTRLFSPFFTTKEVGKGTGLGLSICQGIVTEHGGRIWAESEPGKGATFVVELPVNAAAS